MRKIFTFLMVLILILSTHKVSAETFNPNDHAYIVIDRHTGDILIANDPHQHIFPASTTKILTALIALENARPNAILTASKEAVSAYEWGAVLLNLKEDEEMMLYDLLNVILLRSANDASNVIGEHIGGTLENFYDMMNERARKAGALNSNFQNTHGLHSDDHYSTVYDLALIAKDALNNNIFRSIISRKEYTLPSTNMTDDFPKLQNTNPILGINEGFDFVVLGVKTGYTSKAGSLLVSYADNYMGREVICVVSSMPSRNACADFSLQLIQKAFDDFDEHTVIQPGDIITHYTYDQQEIPLAAAKTISHLLPNDQTHWIFEEQILLYDSPQNKINRGDILGKVVIEYKSKPIGTSYLVAAQSYTRPIATLLQEEPESLPEYNWNHIYYFILFLIGAIITIYIIFELYDLKKKHKRSQSND